MQTETKTPDTDDVIKAIKALTGMHKLTSLWNRRFAESAGMEANEAWQIRGDIWLVRNDDVLFLFVGLTDVAVGRADVLKTITEYLF